MTTAQRNNKRAWMMGLAAATIMSLIGPRPLFVKTAYADSPSPQPNVLAASGSDVGIELEFAPAMPARD